jgi:hypothetical protein
VVFGAAGGVAVVVVRRPSRKLVESYLETNRVLILVPCRSSYSVGCDWINVAEQSSVAAPGMYEGAKNLVVVDLILDSNTSRRAKNFEMKFLLDLNSGAATELCSATLIQSHPTL